MHSNECEKDQRSQIVRLSTCLDSGLRPGGDELLRRVNDLMSQTLYYELTAITFHAPNSPVPSLLR